MRTISDEAGIDTSSFPRLEAWLERVRERSGHVADLAGFPPNSHLGKSRSVYDLFAV